MSKKDEVLEKGLGKLLSSAALAGTMALGHGGIDKPESLSPRNPKPVFSATELKPEHGFDKDALQHAMAQVESNHGLNINHDLLSAGPDAGTRAKGHYGFTNSTIKDVIRNSPSLRNTHKDVLEYNDDQMHNLIYSEQPHLQHHLASEQIGNIVRTLKTNKPEHVAYAWLNGIGGAQKAINERKDINNHWHVKKVMDAYNNIINKQAKKSNHDLVDLLIKKDKVFMTASKTPFERSKEISIDIQKVISEQWKKAREQLNAEDEVESTKPNPLKDWNVDLEDLSNSDVNLTIIDLIKSKVK